MWLPRFVDTLCYPRAKYGHSRGASPRASTVGFTAGPQLITALSQGRGYGEAGGEGLFSSRQISESLTHPPRRVPHLLPRRPGTALRQAHGSTLPFHKLTALSRVEGLTLLERSRREGADRSRSVVNRYFAVRPKCTNASGHSRGCPYFTSRGRDRLNSEPSPGLLFTDTSPSWARRISRVMASPMPAPMAFRSAPGPR